MKRRPKRRLLLHMGWTKTGSTAIQTWAVLNREFLQAQGVRYPEHRSDAAALRGAPMPGNGTVVLPFLGAPARMDRAAAERGVDRVLDDLLASRSPLTVCSNEKMVGQFDSDRFRDFAARVAERRAQLQVAVYVRDIAGHAVSVYAQRVQQGAVTETLDQFLAGDAGTVGYSQRVRDVLEPMVALLGRENVRVRHYDSVRHALIEDFLTEVLAIEDRDGSRNADVRANRSIGLQEVEWKRYLNAQVSGARSKNLGRNLTMLPALAGDERLQITEQGLAHLAERYQSDVDWVNREFFGGEPVMSVQGTTTPVAEAQQPLDVSDRERHLLDWLAGSVEREN